MRELFLLKGKDFMESKSRSLVKAFSWKVVAFITLVITTYFVTGSIKEASIITVIYHLIGVILYFTHERIWNKIKWGNQKHPLSVIEIEGNIDEDDIDLIKEKLKELGYVK